MFTDIKLSKTNFSNVIQSGGFLDNMIDKLGKELLKNFAVPLAKNILPQLGAKTTSFVIDKLERKISEWEVIRAAKVFISFISNNDMDDIIRIVESAEDSGLLIDDVTETIKDKIKKPQEVEFLLHC